MPLHGVIPSDPPARRRSPKAGVSRGKQRRARRTTRMVGAVLVVALVAASACEFVAASGCEPTVIVGVLACSKSPGEGATVANPGDPVKLPWSTGFENGFCTYAPPDGFCFSTGAGGYTLVTSPVHSGQYAAAFSVRSSNADGGSQTRCVRQGAFPDAAYFGAWYYVPAQASNTGLWNLLHYQGGVPGQTLHGLWDVSLYNPNDGGLHISVFDFLTAGAVDTSGVPPIPIAEWFHLEVYFKRSKDNNGEITVWQDGAMAVHLTGVATDDTDWGQWYVGNLATALSPPDSTVYVDDVTIGAAP